MTTEPKELIEGIDYTVERNKDGSIKRYYLIGKRMDQLSDLLNLSEEDADALLANEEKRQ